MDCFAALAMTMKYRSATRSSYPAKAGYPVRRGLSIQSLASLEYWIVRLRGGRRQNMTSRSRGMNCPRFGSSLPSSKTEGAGKTGCLLHPRSRVRFAQTKLHTSIQGSGNTPAFPAQWLYGLLRALPGERLFCLRRRRDRSRQLNASTAAPEPHDFTVRIRRVRLARHLRPSHLTARS